MFKIFRYMKDQWYWIVLVIVLLIVQAQCDLSLPEYTSKIIDTGIQNQGIEHGVPELITGEEYQKLTMFMTKEEQTDWESIYEETDDGNYHLTITEDTERWTEADQEFQTVILLNASMRKMSEESLQTMTEKMLQAQESDRDQMIRQMREEMESQTEQIGSTMLTSIAISYAAEEYQAAGGDIHALQRQYLLKTGGKMLALTLLMAAAAIAAGFLAARIGAKVGMELRGKVFKKVVTFTNREMDQFSTASLITRSTNDIQQVQMVSTMMLRMLIYAPILGIGGVIHVLNTGAGMEWIILVAVVTILVFVGILMKIAMPKFKQMQQKVDIKPWNQLDQR